jgi:GT2 family glycosyltransferase
VPVWQGAEFVGETLESVLRQRDVELAVLVSIDGADAASAEACRPFLADRRVDMVIQPERLGWVRNSAAVAEPARAAGARYQSLQPHDDVMSDGYLATLMEVAECSPKAAVVYSDIQTIGTVERKNVQTSVTGSPLERQLQLLARHFDAVAWRGLTRVLALSNAAPRGRSAFQDFAADTVWMARLAREGDLIRVPQTLYLKRRHDRNTHSEWRCWPKERKVQAWTEHCLAMLEEAIPVASNPEERRNLLETARFRLLHVGQQLGPYKDELSNLSAEERAQMLAEFEAELSAAGMLPPAI